VLNWNFRLFSIFGIDVRIHWTLPLILMTQVLRQVMDAPAGDRMLALAYGAALMGGLWIAILLHELGHCAAARARQVDVDSILLWPLGGLATIGGTGGPRSEIAIAVAGPLVSLLLAGLCLSYGLLVGFPFSWGLFDPFYGWNPLQAGFATALAIDLFKLNMILALFNLCLPAYPLDGGRVLRGLFALRMGFERATLVCTSVAIVVAFLLGFWGLIQQQLYLVLTGIFILYQAVQERKMLREGAIEGYDQSYLGQDFSMGADEDALSSPRPRRPGFFESLRRRRQERIERRLQEEEARLRERVDQILDKVNREGMTSLTPDERRFLKEASRRFQEFQARHEK
jgi:Zn-dependent protease